MLLVNYLTMKKIYLLLLVLPFFFSCSSDDELSPEEQKEKEKEEQMSQQVKALTIYSIGTHKKDIDFDIQYSADTLIRAYARGEITSGDPINPQTVFCLKDDKINSILIEYTIQGFNESQFTFDVSCFDPKINIEFNRSQSGMITELKSDSIKSKYILVRNGYLHFAPKTKTIIIEYSQAQ